MKSNHIARILAGSLCTVFALQGCTPSESTESPMAPESVKASARIAIPANPASLTPWPIGFSTAISYYLNGTLASSTVNHHGTREAFKEWSAALQGASMHVRFFETSDPENANIVVSLSGTGSIQAGCVNQTGRRLCNLSLPSVTDILQGIGLTMGVQASTVPGDVMYKSTFSAIFTDNDLSRIASTFGLYNYEVVPVFNVPYAKTTGSEIVVGWQELRSRTYPYGIYVTNWLNKRVVVGAGMATNNGSPGAMGWPLTASILSYSKWTSGYTSYSKWPYLDRDPSGYDATYGLSGIDPAPGVLGYPGCPEANVAPQSSGNPVAQLFGFDPSMTWIGGYPSASKGPVRYNFGQTIPLYFYKDLSTSRYNVSASYPSGNVGCVRLGGYAFALE